MLARQMQTRGVIASAHIAEFGRLHEDRGGPRWLGRAAFAVQEHVGERHFRPRIAGFRRLLVPAPRNHIVLVDAQAPIVEIAKIEDARRDAPTRRRKIQAARLAQVLRPAAPVTLEVAEHGQRIGPAALGRRSHPPERLRVVARDAHPVRKQRVDGALRHLFARHRLQPDLRTVRLGVDTRQMKATKLELRIGAIPVPRRADTRPRLQPRSAQRPGRAGTVGRCGDRPRRFLAPPPCATTRGPRHDADSRGERRRRDTASPPKPSRGRGPRVPTAPRSARRAPRLRVDANRHGSRMDSLKMRNTPPSRYMATEREPTLTSA